MARLGRRASAADRVDRMLEMCPNVFERARDLGEETGIVPKITPFAFGALDASQRCTSQFAEAAAPWNGSGLNQFHGVLWPVGRHPARCSDQCCRAHRLIRFSDIQVSAGDGQGCPDTVRSPIPWHSGEFEE